VILPVGGPIYLSASAAIKDSGKNTVMLGVDADLAVADPRSPTRSSSPS
jgi:basic membrane protein A